MKQADWYEYTSVIAPRPERTPPGTVTPCSKSVTMPKDVVDHFQTSQVFSILRSIPLLDVPMRYSSLREE